MSMSPAGANMGGGHTASVYQPSGQAGVDAALGQLTQPLLDVAGNAGAGTPGAWSYPQAQGVYSGYLDPSSPYAQAALTGAQGAAGYGSSMLGPTAGYAGQFAGGAFDPMYSSIISQMESNPFYSPAMAGASQGFYQGQQGARSMQDSANAITQAGFDPQAALFDRTQQQLMDQASVANAMSGTGSSPYGAGTMDRALSDFDINWQNQQLGRQTQAAQAASPLYQNAANLSASSGSMPNAVFNQQMQQILAALNARNAAGAQGLQGIQAGNQAIGGLNTLTGLPYGTASTIGGNAMSGLSNATNLGNNQYQLPLQLMNPLLQYLGLGQSASQTSGNLGQMGYNQLAGGIGGGLSALGGLGSMFGALGPFGSGGALSGIGSTIGGWFR